MTRKASVPPWQDELVEAFHQGNEEQARALAQQVRAQSRQARAMFETMLSAQEARVRQAAAFGLGVLGGSASARRLEQQLAIEEARGDHDGASVSEVITEALGRIEDVSARASLVRRLDRLARQTPEPADVNALARALWRKRHLELKPAVQHALEQLPPSAAGSLRALGVLLEKSPEALRAWFEAPAVPLEDKTELLTVLEEDVPDQLLPVMPTLVTTARALAETAVAQRGAAAAYCDRLFTLFLLHHTRALASLPRETRGELHAAARLLVAAKSLGCAVRAAHILGMVGLPEDASLLAEHRPEDPILAEVFDKAVQALRTPRK
jgi:hypothetical protein